MDTADHLMVCFEPDEAAVGIGVLAARTAARMRELVQPLRPEDLDVFGSLTPCEQVNICAHPFFRFWWLRLLSALQRGEINAESSWLDHLRRFLVVPALRAGLSVRFASVPVHLNGELRLPGSFHSLPVPAGASTVALTVTPHGVHAEAAGSNVFHLKGAVLAGAEGDCLIPGTQIELDAGDAWIREHLAQLNLAPPEPPYPRRNVQPLAPVPACTLWRYAEAFAAIDRAWPALEREIAGYVRLVVPFSGRELVGWTHVVFNGAIFINSIDYDGLPFLVERIVHESSHVRLYTMMELTPLDRTDRAVLVRSPLRSDGRPVAGVLHATFVSARVARFMSRAADVLGDACYLERADRAAAQYREGAATLRKHAQLTEHGAALLDAVDEAVGAYR